MKAEITETGTLRVSAENALESFALSQWAAQYFNESEKQDPAINLLIESKGDTNE